MKTIMVATDFSERSDRALRRATLLARQFESAILLVHVVDDDQPRRIVDAERDEATTLLRQMAATLSDVDGVTTETRVILASPFVGIAQAVKDVTPDLLVIGPHRRQVLRDVFVGTTAERTIRSVDCPVLIVNATPVGHYRHVLQTTDLSDSSRDALLRFQELGLADQSRTSLLHIFDAPALRLVFSHSIPKDDQKHYLEEEQRDASLNLVRFLSSAGLGHPRQIVRYEATPAPHEILKAAGEEQADLIVMSTHGRSGLAKMLIGSVTEQVLRTAQIDVLAIPPQRGE
ncbi:universal stress protein (plasmid) [Martelella lutilitoris]|uniref:Universal stress protein n=1 Tax=Martelella lutilitoris TaxID=2583532 RepID=A0A7T7HPD7_9HYPH|nr:universal stress protein [Martelella lutilitoris]QQM32849.1 universal stress protein [Martelella lutilitoris]QRX65057.1 universal stress protein [Dysgonomonadaceae bacterium zrk40]